MKEVGECIVPARAPKDAMQQYGEVLANDMIAFSYTVIIYRGEGVSRPQSVGPRVQVQEYSPESVDLRVRPPPLQLSLIPI